MGFASMARSAESHKEIGKKAQAKELGVTVSQESHKEIGKGELYSTRTLGEALNLIKRLERNY